MHAAVVEGARHRARLQTQAGHHARRVHERDLPLHPRRAPSAVAGGRVSLPIVSESSRDGEVAPAKRTAKGSILERRVALAELLDLQAFRDVCASFVDLYKIGIKIFDGDGTKLVDI